MRRREAFTLIELLISIALLSLILLALYKSLGLLQNSNLQLFQYLKKSAEENLVSKTLFLDITGSDGNITIDGDEFSRLCIENTINSLHELPSAKVCWVVAKEGNQLLRSEGNNYTLPLSTNSRISVDATLKDIDHFRVYRQKDGLLILLRQKNKKPISFLVQGVAEPAQPGAKELQNPAKKQKSAPKSLPPVPNQNP